jgi:hypothetical protein
VVISCFTAKEDERGDKGGPSWKREDPASGKATRLDSRHRLCAGHDGYGLDQSSLSASDVSSRSTIIISRQERGGSGASQQVSKEIRSMRERSHSLTLRAPDQKFLMTSRLRESVACFAKSSVRRCTVSWSSCSRLFTFEVASSSKIPSSEVSVSKQSAAIGCRKIV